MKASIISGILVFIFSLILINFSNLELLSLMISQFIIQLFYNNWKWPSIIIKKYNLNLNLIYREFRLYIKNLKFELWKKN